MKGMSKMKKTRIIAIIALLCAALFVVTACGGGGQNEPQEQAQATPSPAPTPTPGAPAATPTPAPAPAVEGPPRVLRVGTWNPNNFDPNFRDAVTGEITMVPQRHFGLATAFEAVLEQMNIELQWIPYVQDVREVLLTSVLAGDPFADIVGLWGGSQGAILGQNILRPIDQFADIFTCEESDWMWMEPLFGTHWFLVDQIRHAATWPMVFNISLLEQVDGLRDANGNTVFPTCLYMRGEWTWSEFERYLEIVEAHFRGVPAPVRPEYTITPFQTDHRFTARKAFHSAGVAIFGGEGLQITSPEAIQAVEFLDRLVHRDLMNVQFSNPATAYPGWTWTAADFGRSEMVFSELPYWLVASAGSALAERGESMGIIPFPRADFIPAGDPRARMESTPGNSWGVLRGIDDETTRLVLEAWRLFTIEYWRAFGGVSNVAEYRAATAMHEAVLQGFDIFHPVVGADVLHIFTYYSSASPNEFAGMIGIDGFVTQNIIAHSIWGVDGAPSFSVNVHQRLPEVYAMIDRTGGALAGDAFVDNHPPANAWSLPVFLAMGSDVNAFDFTPFLTITDAVDGVMPSVLGNGIYAIQWGGAPWEGIDVSTPGTVAPGVRIRSMDRSGNLTGWSQQPVMIFDPANTAAPEFVLQEEFPEVELDSPAADINWNQFVYSARDAHGNDLRARMVPDLGELDVTLPGTYPVEITVEDFAGNVASIIVEVVVR